MLKDAARVTAGQSLLLYAAAGGMGNAVIDLARAWGLSVIGVVGTTRCGSRRSWARIP